MSVSSSEQLATVVTIQPVELEAQNEMEVQPKLSSHPFGSVLLRLELAIAVIEASRRQASPAKAKVRARRMR
jgi:hypothetical protein